jgi:Nif-specific regulatory protein
MPSLIITRNGIFENLVDLGGNLSIGRDQKNEIILKSPDVSRFHASIERGDGDQYILFDQRSRNGIWIDNQRVSRVPLTDALGFTIADYQFQFRSQSSGNTIQWMNRTRHADDENDIHLQETAFLAFPEDMPGSRLSSGMDAQRVSFLDRIQELIDIYDYRELIQKVLALSVEMIGGEVAYLVLEETGSGTGPMFYKHASDALAEYKVLKVSQSIIAKVLHHGRPLCIADAPKENPSPSVVAAGVQSAVCVPLTRGKKTIGCLYIDSRERCGALSQDALKILQALGFITAIAVENAWLKRLSATDSKRALQVGYSENTRINSEIMRDLYRKADLCAGSGYSVLIRGEAGTGKDLLARYIHLRSSRNDNYVAFNCSAVAGDLLESELFGSKKGAFSGAIDRQGKVGAAAGGTLFLDEIGDLSLPLQPKLLRFLENKSYYRVGDNQERHEDVRIIAATNRDLEKMVTEGRFRQDLFDRLNTIPLQVPPLRHRREEIKPLFQYLVQICADENEREPFTLEDKAMDTLTQYDWPGNVRELKNLVRRLAVLVPERSITLKRLLRVWQEYEPKIAPEPTMTLEEMEKRHIRNALSQNKWNIVQTARALGIVRDTLRRKMKKFRIEKPQTSK